MHLPWWETTPALAPISLVAALGTAGGLAISLAAFGAIAWGSLTLERRRHGTSRTAARAFDLVHGPWSLTAGAVGLVLVQVATLALAGRPWGVTSAFALWGSKTVAALGVDVASWPYWSSPANAVALRGSVLKDVTSVMNLGIMLGAFAAAGLAGRFAPLWRVPLRSLGGAIAGGLLLGYGARIAYGCNIGAFFSGVGSGSLHGWVWFPAAFTGGIVGTRLRPWFGLRVERTPR